MSPKDLPANALDLHVHSAPDIRPRPFDDLDLARACLANGMAGAGIKGGASWGETDELGYAVAKDHVSVHDLHATMLRQLGINHERLTYRFQGLDFRLTGVEKARVVEEVLS